MPNGSLYSGKTGFLFKNSGGAGNSRYISSGMFNLNRHLDNRYISGSGVGATTISNRRALKTRSSSGNCNCLYNNNNNNVNT